MIYESELFQKEDELPAFKIYSIVKQERRTTRCILSDVRAHKKMKALMAGCAIRKKSGGPYAKK